MQINRKEQIILYILCSYMYKADLSRHVCVFDIKDKFEIKLERRNTFILAHLLKIVNGR